MFHPSPRVAAEDSLVNLGLQTGRRSTLPVPRPDTGDVGLLSLLTRNIGRDLSKISMPVTLNEPLNMLQVGGARGVGGWVGVGHAEWGGWGAVGRGAEIRNRFEQICVTLFISGWVGR